MTEHTAENDAHDGWSFDLTTPREYTARHGWNVYCACGEHIGESGDADLGERHERHVGSIIPPVSSAPATESGQA